MNNTPTTIFRAASASRAARVPWLTLLIAVAALYTHAWRGSALADACVGGRLALAQGEWWRAWTAHLVHFSWSHLLASGLVWLAAGALVERADRRALAALLALGAPFVTWGALAFDPALARYGGLSGLAMAALTWLAVHWLSRRTDHADVATRIAGAALLALIAGKITWELLHAHAGAGWLATFEDTSEPVRIATGAHLAGACWGGVLAVVRRGTRRRPHASGERIALESVRHAHNLPHT